MKKRSNKVLKFKKELHIRKRYVGKEFVLFDDLVTGYGEKAGKRQLYIRILDLMIKEDPAGYEQWVLLFQSTETFAYRRYKFRILEQLKHYYNITNCCFSYAGIYQRKG